ncbi:MAG: DUF460 domain-containing protein [Candidatus Methanodesulfokora washburnensis]
MSGSSLDSTKTVVGVDLISGSPRSKKGAKYAVSVIKGEKEVDKLESATFYDLMKIARRYDADIIAVDNVFELIGRARDIYSLMSRLPRKTRIVQVTITDKGIFESLKDLAEAYNIALDERDPLSEARASAVLASKGVGKEILTLKPECRILISRNRSVKQGGSGRERWMRSLDAVILEETRRIEDALRKAEIDYDLYALRSPGGLRRAEFIVYEAEEKVRERLAGVLKEDDWGPVRISLVPAWESQLKFVKEQSNRPILVGLDPGLNFGIAIIDLDGRIVHLCTLRRASRSEVIDEIVSHGSPIIIATDVDPPPKNVLKIAGSLGVRVEVAKKEMRTDEKMDIILDYVREEPIKLGSVHERDSLAAVLKVYKRLKPLFSKAMSRVRELGVELDRNILLRRLVEGYAIDDAIKLSSEVKQEQRREIAREIQVPADCRKLVERINSMKEIINEYREMLRQKEAEIRELRAKIEKLEDIRAMEIEKDRRIEMRDRRIEELTKELENERRINEILRKELERIAEREEEVDLSGWIPLKVVRSLSVDDIKYLINKGRITSNDVILVLDISGAGQRAAKFLKQTGIRVLIYRGGSPSHEFLDEIRGSDILLVDGSKLELRWRGVVPYIKEEDLLRLSSEAEIDEREEINILNVLKEYREKLIKNS